MVKQKRAKQESRIEAAATHNVFISWSGERSKGAADALREWLPIILQAARPWTSGSDIEKGSRGLEEVARALEGMKVGIICLTPESLGAEWILYEAGALSKTLDAKTRVCTYLLAGLRPEDVKPPLGMFQATKADKEDTRKLVHTINKHLDVPPVPEVGLNALFDKMWPDLEHKLSALPKPTGAPSPKRPLDEMVAEVLEINRAMAPQVGAIADEIDFNRRVREVQQAMLRSQTSNFVVTNTLGHAADAFAVSPSPATAEPTDSEALPKKPLPTSKRPR